MVGNTITHYKILEKIGEGGMGEVYRAWDTQLRREVALKVLLARAATDPDRRQRFEREAQAVAALNHPNVVSIYDFGTENGIPFIVTELVQGESLRALMRRGRLPLQRVINIAIQTADGLAAAHAAGIIHRDLKPENIMVTRTGRVKILDFGLAKHTPMAAGDSADTITMGHTRAGVVVGTAGYMSPEQVRGKPVDHRSDIFSYGAVLYEMLATRPAFERDSAVETMNAILNDDPPEFDATDSSIPFALQSIVRHCLEKGREERFQSAWDLAFALEAISKHSSSGAVPAVPYRFFGRKKLRLAGLALFFLAAGSLLTYLAVQLGAPRERLPATSPVFVQLTDGPGPELFPSLSPEGDLLVYAGKVSGNWDIYRQEVGSTNWVNLTEDCLLNDTQPAFSPDGKLIAFRSERDGGGIFVMDEGGASVRRLADFGYNPAWSPDGNKIVFAEEGVMRPEDRQKALSRLWSVDLSSGDKTLVTDTDAVQPQWSPHGDRIAYWALVEGGRRGIYTIPATGGSPIPVTHDNQYMNWNPVWSPQGDSLYFSSDRGGGMNVWRVSIREDTGRVSGEPQLVKTPSSYVRHLSFSRVGGRMAYVQNVFSASLWRVAFDPAEEIAIGQPTEITEGSELASRPDLSPDGEWLAFNSSGNEEDLFVVKVDGTGLRQLTHDRYKDRGPRWSPDGKRIAFFSMRTGNWEIWTFGLEDNGLEQITSIPSASVIWPVWAPDQKRIAYTIFGHNSFLLETGKPWAEQSPRPLPAFESRDESFSVWSWSPDGRRLAGVQKLADGSYSGIVVHDLASGRYEKLTDFGVEPEWLNDSRRLLFQHQGRLHLVDSQSKKVRRDVLSVAPGEVAGRGFALSRDNYQIYFSVPKTEADVWLLSFGEDASR